MARKCIFTGKAVQAGNKVSHSNRKTRTRFLPNLQNVTLISETLGCKIKLRVSTNALRSIEVNGGLDSYLLSTNNKILAPEALAIKRRLQKKLANNQNI